MKTACPACGAAFSLDTVLGHEGARALVAELAAISGPLAGAVLRYLGLFRPAPRSLSWDRAARLLAELAPMIRDARIERGGRAYAAPRDAWIAAIEHMLDHRERLSLPLKSHGYLLEVLVGAVNSAEARQEAAREDRRAGRTRVGGQVPANPAPTPPEPPEPPRANPETIAKTLAAAKNIVNQPRKEA